MYAAEGGIRMPPLQRSRRSSARLVVIRPMVAWRAVVGAPQCPVRHSAPELRRTSLETEVFLKPALDYNAAFWSTIVCYGWPATVYGTWKR